MYELAVTVEGVDEYMNRCPPGLLKLVFGAGVPGPPGNPADPGVDGGPDPSFPSPPPLFPYEGNTDKQPSLDTGFVFILARMGLS